MESISRETGSQSISTEETVDVSGDDDSDAYRGTGGLLLPSSYSGSASSRKTIASCLNCVWRYTLYCQQSSMGFCAHAVITCPNGKVRYRVWFGKTNQTTKVVGTVCWGVSKPATRREIEQQVNSSAVRYVPALMPGVSPRGSTLTSVPIIVWSGQPAVFTPKPMYLAGHEVRIRATAVWQWVWGDGSSLWTGMPGGQYPNRALTHQYRKQGHYNVQVRSIWRATYFVAGLGSFTTAGNLVGQTKQFPVLVRSGHAVLVAR